MKSEWSEIRRTALIHHFGIVLFTTSGSQARKLGQRTDLTAQKVGWGPPQSPVVTVPLGREVVAGWRSGASEIFPEIFYRKQTSGVYERVLHSYAALSFIGLTMRGRGKRKLKINIWGEHDCQG